MAALAAKAVKDQRRKAAQLKLADKDEKQNRKQSLTSVTTMGSFDPEVWHHIADLYMLRFTKNNNSSTGRLHQF